MQWRRMKERQGFQLASWAVLGCLAALIYVWVPSVSEKDSFRTWKLNDPALGRWLYTEKDLRAVKTEIFAMADMAKELSNAKGYTAEKHFRNIKRLYELKNSILPLEAGSEVLSGLLPAYRSYDGRFQSIPNESVGLNRELQLQFITVDRELGFNFGRMSSREEQIRYAEMSKEAGLSKLVEGRTLDSDWYWHPFWGWFIQTYLQSVFLSFVFFLLRAEFIGQKKRLLFYDAPRTAFWMFCWPVGIWIYPTSDPVALVRLVRHRLAVALSFFFTVAVPNFAMAQSGKSDNQKKRDNQHTLVLTAEVVDKYYGPVVGEIFALEPAPRLMARYARETSKGQLYLDSWNSWGKGFNAESDFGVGFQRSGLDVSYTHFFVRGGDIENLGLSKSFSIGIFGRRAPLGASLLYYFGSGSTSPPGGTIAKISTGTGQDIGPIRIQHSFLLGVDNNPFGVGNGWTSMGFYRVRAGFKRLYFGFDTSAPLLGQGNTSRGFRWGIAAGYSHSFAW